LREERRKYRTWHMSMHTATDIILNAARKSDEMLEPYEWKRSRTVLRRESGSNPADLVNYTNLVKALGGELLYISESSDTHLNPLEISLEEYNRGEDVVSSKYDFFLSFFETIMGKSGISPEQKTIIDNCLHEVYRDFLLGNTTEMPTLKDYYEILSKQQSEEAKPLYMSLELYVNGSMKTFSYPSNVNVNNRVVVYDIKDLGKQLKPLGMMVVLENLWDKIVRNRERGIRTPGQQHLLFRKEKNIKEQIRF